MSKRTSESGAFTASQSDTTDSERSSGKTPLQKAKKLKYEDSTTQGIISRLIHHFGQIELKYCKLVQNRSQANGTDEISRIKDCLEQENPFFKVTHELLTERLKDLDQTITPNTAPKKKKRSPTEKKQDISIQVSIDDILDAFIESCARFRSKCRDIIARIPEDYEDGYIVERLKSLKRTSELLLTAFGIILRQMEGGSPTRNAIPADLVNAQQIIIQPMASSSGNQPAGNDTTFH